MKTVMLLMLPFFLISCTKPQEKHNLVGIKYSSRGERSSITFLSKTEMLISEGNKTFILQYKRSGDIIHTVFNMEGETKSITLNLTGEIITSPEIDVVWLSPKVQEQYTTQITNMNYLKTALLLFKNEYGFIPDGTIIEVVNILSGNDERTVNKRGLMFLNHAGDLTVDLWGSGLKFELNSNGIYTITSAGYDREFGTELDIVTTNRR